MRIREYREENIAELHALDMACFAEGISYSRRMLEYFLRLPSSCCLVAQSPAGILGFILAASSDSHGHIITLDVAEAARRTGAGSALLLEMEARLMAVGVESVRLETAVDNAAGIAFWEHHGYGTEAVKKRYYLGRIDAFQMRKKIEQVRVAADPSPAREADKG